MDQQDKEALIKYRIEQAHETISEVEKLIEIDFLKTAVNRIYYGMFYCLSALALKNNFTSSKHLQLIGWFNKNFIKTGIVEAKYGRIIRNAFKNRNEGDYAPYIEFHKEDVNEMKNDLEDFINRIIPLCKFNDSY